MKCMNCGANAEKSTTTFVKDLGKCIVIIKNVPCHKCSECNETIYTADVLKKIESIIDNLKDQMMEIAVTDFSSAA